MDRKHHDWAMLLGRFLISLIFILSGFEKIPGFSHTAATMATKGLPFPGLLLVLAIIIELGGGIMLLIGWHARLAALVIFLYLIPVTAVFHNFWAAPPAQAQEQQINFLKNLSIMGAMLYIFAAGPGRYHVGRRKMAMTEPHSEAGAL